LIILKAPVQSAEESSSPELMAVICEILGFQRKHKKIIRKMTSASGLSSTAGLR
jgi:hypothetical protein